MGVDTAGLTTDLTTVFEDLDPAKTAADAAADVAQAVHDNVGSAPDHTDTIAPTVNDDVTLGYIIGSRWVIIGSDEYVCLDNTDGAAVWRNTTAGGASLSSNVPAALGSASAGTGTAASRDDHVHAMPSASDVGAVPTGRTLTGTAPVKIAGGSSADLSADRTISVDVMVGDAGAGGSAGLVPAPAAGDATKFLRGDGTFATPTSGAGDVVGPAGATDGAPAVFDGVTGKLLKQLIGEGVLGLVAGVLTKITTTLGDLVYGGASGTPTRLDGNTTTTQKVLTQTGDGAASAAPAWTAVSGLTVGDASNPGVLKLGANGGAMKYRDTAYAYVSRDSNGDASDLVASSATAPYAFQPVFAQLDSSGHPALLESWAPDPFFGGAYACLNAAAAATPSTSGVFVSAVTSGTVSNVTATYTDGHGWFRFATGTGPTSTAGVDAGGIYVCQTAQHWKVRSTFRVSSIAAAYTIWFVVANAGPSAPPTHYMGLRWIQGTDVNLQVVSKDGTTASSTDSTVAFAANTTYEVVMSWDGTTFTVSINGTTVTKTTNMPATTENLGVYLRMFKASGATNYSLDIRDGVQIARLQ